MLKKTITYEDFNGETVSEDFFFHLSQAELVELELSHQGGLSVALQRIIDAEDMKSLIEEFTSIILTSYGQKSLDGKRFIKTQELRDQFKSSKAYSDLFMELITNTGAAIEFVNGVVPTEMAAEIAKLTEAEPTPLTPVPEEENLVPVPELQIVTRADVEKMSGEELAKLGDRIQAGEVKIAE